MIEPASGEPGLDDASAPFFARRDETRADDPASFERVVREIVSARADAGRWTIRHNAETAPWIKVEPAGASVPAQGWKLHVSANVPGATEVLRRALPVLLDAGATFKLAETHRFLAELNQGGAAFSQIGKFITVYPRNDAEAVALAVSLDRATLRMHGPAVPSDRRLNPGSQVFYRYGAFASRYTQTPLGELLPAIVAPDGEIMPDRREAFAPPAWARDPFQEAGVTSDPPAQAGAAIIGDRYVVLATLQSSARGSVHLAFDTVEPRACVLKHARQGSTVDRHGRDALDRLRREAQVLTTLADDARLPRFYGLHEYDGDLFLAMEDVAGQTLGGHVQATASEGGALGEDEVVRIGRVLADIVQHVHEAGFIYRDLKSSNVIMTDDGLPRLIDFELALEPTSDDVERFGYGTPGYMSPQQVHAEAPAVTDDVYALGALIYLLATGAEPSQASAMTSLLARPVELLNPEIGPGLIAVITRCLTPEPANRFQTAAEVDKALRAAGSSDLHRHATRSDLGAPDEPAARARSRQRARRLGDTLCAQSIEAGDGGGRYWRSPHPQASGFLSTDINTGCGGIVLALAEIVSELNNPTHRAVLADAARWLLTAPRPEGAPPTGLYVGDGAIGAALLRAGQVLHDPSLMDAAAERGRYIASLPHRSPDLFNGTAGRIRFHQWLFDATGDLSHLEDAISGGETLLASAQATTGGGVTWTMPEGYSSLSGPLGTGYAHGVAGVADVLLDLFDATDDIRFRELSAGAARWLARQASPMLADGSGLGWPDKEGGAPMAGYWCHGAPGIGRFMLHAAQRNLIPGAWDLALGAARTAAYALRFSGPSQCHGLAGNIETLLDAYQATGDPQWLQTARDLERLLDAWFIEQDGHLLCSSDIPNVYSPDYMVGYSGVAMALLRLARPERLPHQLSRAGFGGTMFSPGEPVAQVPSGEMIGC